MDASVLDTIMHAGGIVLAAGVSYGAIKQDLKHTAEKSEEAKTIALDANRKINQHYLDHAQRRFTDHG